MSRLTYKFYRGLGHTRLTSFMMVHGNKVICAGAIIGGVIGFCWP